jgi:hypothetical protein
MLSNKNTAAYVVDSSTQGDSVRASGWSSHDKRVHTSNARTLYSLGSWSIVYFF